MKIALSGSQGSGKTTLMNALSAKHNLNILQADTRSLMPKGISSHKDVLTLAVTNPDEGIKFQEKLIKTRAELFKSAKQGFISDRAVFDSFIYYSVHNSMFAQKELDKELRNITNESLNDLDILVVLSPILTDIDNNDVRVTTTSYYEVISTLIQDSIKNSILANDPSADTTFGIQISDNLIVDIWYANSTAVLFLYERFGMDTVENRMKAIEVSFELLKLKRGNK